MSISMKSQHVLGWDTKSWGLVLAAIAAIGLLPFLLDQYWLHVSIMILFYIMMASSWNLLAGYTGQVSLAHAAFAGVGAYTSGILAAKFGLHPLLGLPIGILLAAILGLGLGVLCIRMGGIYLTLTTLAFSEIIRLVINNEYEITRGTMGLQVPFLFGDYSKVTGFYVMMAATILVLFVIRKILYSDLGQSFRAIQNDEVAAASVGLPVVRIRVAAFVITAAMAGMAGSIYGHYLLLITPHINSLDMMFLVLAMAMIGGLGNYSGPIIGAIFLETLAEHIRVWGEFHVFIYGLVALAIVRFAPLGIVGSLTQYIHSRKMRAPEKETAL
ncbi:MAG: branched-chain amino acid ABC transporter permease [Desulfovermiculus sp.]|nr:branched-chain amino acid ABC transporter permease [Desulfovermiculus sp.]